MKNREKNSSKHIKKLQKEPKDAVFLFEDEFSLSNTATVSYSWSIMGKQPLIDCKQRGKERQTGFGCVNIKTGQMTVSFEDHGNYQSFKKYLKKILCTYAYAPKVIIFLDNVRYHHANLLKKFLIKHDKLELIYLPPYSPDLNPVERAWWYMRKSITHNRYINTLKERKAYFWKLFSHYLIPNKQILNLCVFNY
jgi:transposase